MKLIIIVFFLPTLVLSKTKPVKGYVKEENFNALANVEIFSLPSKTSTVSDEERLKRPSSSETVLVFEGKEKILTLAKALEFSFLT